MLKSLNRLVALICLVLFSISSVFVCWADEGIYTNKEILTDMKNQNAWVISEFSANDIGLAKSLKDAYIAALPYDVEKTAYNNAWQFYQEYKRLICDLNGDFSMFSKQELAEAVLFTTSYAVDARNISGYSIINELLGTENIIQIKDEGIRSICCAYIALSCHNDYLAISKEERKQLLDEILNYKYDNLEDISYALVAISNDESTPSLQKWKKERWNQIIKIYNSGSYSTEYTAQIIIAAAINNIDINGEERLYKDGQSIIHDFYKKIAMDETKDKQWIKNVLNALTSYENYCLKLNNQIFFNNRINLRSDENYINTDIYNYLLKESDISRHWSKNMFLKMVLNSSIPYDYYENEYLFPDSSITRGEFITWISKYKNINISNNSYFLDIDDPELSKIINGFVEETIFKYYQTDLEKYQFLKNYFEGGFRPNDSISREEAAFFLKCAYGYIHLEEKETDLINNFQDYNNCSERYKDAINFCVRYGYISGRENMIVPKGALTRAEAAVLISRDSINLT